MHADVERVSLPLPGGAQPPGLGFGLRGNAQFTWFGAAAGYIYARDCGDGFAPAIYDIANDTWEALTDPKTSDNYDGHATYDSKRRRLHFSSYDDISGFNFAWYYQF